MQVIVKTRLQNRKSLYGTMVLFLLLWLCLSFCSAPASIKRWEQPVLYTVVDNLQLRNAPHIQAGVLARLPQGTEVQPTGQKSAHSWRLNLRGRDFDLDWIEIRYGNSTGWVYGAGLYIAKTVPFDYFKKYIKPFSQSGPLMDQNGKDVTTSILPQGFDLKNSSLVDGRFLLQSVKSNVYSVYDLEKKKYWSMPVSVLYPFSNGLAAFGSVGSDGYGFVNQAGEVAIEAMDWIDTPVPSFCGD